MFIRNNINSPFSRILFDIFELVKSIYSFTTSTLCASYNGICNFASIFKDMQMNIAILDNEYQFRGRKILLQPSNFMHMNSAYKVRAGT